MKESTLVTKVRKCVIGFDTLLRCNLKDFLSRIVPWKTVYETSQKVINVSQKVSYKTSSSIVYIYLQNNFSKYQSINTFYDYKTLSTCTDRFSFNLSRHKGCEDTGIYRYSYRCIKTVLKLFVYLNVDILFDHKVICIKPLVSWCIIQDSIRN